MRYIPDLRADISGITLDHCTVLLERLRHVIDVQEGQEGIGSEFILDVDSQDMLDLYKSMFQPDEFNRLFMTELGKGVLVGVFMNHLHSQFDLEGLDEE